MEGSKPTSRDHSTASRAFNTNGIIYDNSPWRPGREPAELREISENNDRKIKNVATRIMSNGVEVLVRDKNSDGKHDQTKFMEIKTIQPSAPSNMFVSSFSKIDKRIDNKEENSHTFDLIQPSEVSQPPCSLSCSCSNTKTESLKTQYTTSLSASEKYNTKTSNYGFVKVDVRPTQKETDNQSQYEHDVKVHSAPTDKIVEKYTEFVNDYSDEKDANSVKESDLLTNEQAPTVSNKNKISNSKVPEDNKTEKPVKTNKNKFVVADLFKLGSLGIKGLSQLAPVIEKMTDTFMKRQDTNKTTATNIKPIKKLTPYNANERVDSDLDLKHNNFPIYIPVDEMETSESQIAFTNATLHQNFAWASELKQPKSRIAPPKIIHESPLVNGGIPISPGEIITANSDVIVGKPAVGGPLTLVASGIKLQNPVNPPPIDNFMSNSESYLVAENSPFNEKSVLPSTVDDSFDLRPPDLPKIKSNPTRDHHRQSIHNMQNLFNKKIPSVLLHQQKVSSEPVKETSIGNHGSISFMDYSSSLTKPNKNLPFEQHVDFRPSNKGNQKEENVIDNNPSASEIISTSVTTDGEYAVSISHDLVNKPFLVDIQPSRVANVIIPHGSSTALVFAGSSEPHKTGDYIDDPLPYPEPGYFGSFSIDAPQMTYVHNFAPNNKPILVKSSNPSTYQGQQLRNDFKPKWKDTERPADFNTMPASISNQEINKQVGPQILYNPDIYKSDAQKYNVVGENDKSKSGKEVIDKEYENYLAVPPPPPSKVQLNHDNRFDKNKSYNQRPVIHSKPIQDMKVFLNMQHPMSKAPNHDQMPPKVTSEIYFAVQNPNSKLIPPYRIHLPHTPSLYENKNVNSPVSNTQSNKNYNSHIDQGLLAMKPGPNVNAENLSKADGDIKNIGQMITFDTTYNEANNNKYSQNLSMSSTSTPQLDQFNTDIPIGTNIAIRVEDDPSRYESIAIHSNKKPNIYDNHGRTPPRILLQNNQWNKTEVPSEFIFIPALNNNVIEGHIKKDIYPSLPPSFNSHANFPMINDYTTSKYDFVTQIISESDNTKVQGDQKRPAKLIPNIPTNSHSWHSSMPVIPENGNNLNKINSIYYVEATTRKIIPISFNYNKESVPEFGEKIAGIGKPPVWQNSQDFTSNLSIGRPFSKSQVNKDPSSSSSMSTIIKPNYSENYLPSNLEPKQPAYEIPIKDNSHETTTAKIVKNKKEKLKPVYENSEEVYDGEEEFEHNDSADGEVSLESIKVPVVTSSSETENTSLSSGDMNYHRGQGFQTNTHSVSYYSGTQTEKPFITYNNSQGVRSNTIKPNDYVRNTYMKPRPFKINTITPLDHQLQQPHWQINQLMENSTNMSYEETLDLNIGEEMSTTHMPSLQATSSKKDSSKDLLKLDHQNRTQVTNETANIITSTVHIKDKKPLLLEVTEKSNLPSFTITTDLNHNKSSDIINLSPPPPIFDFSFKPSTKDEIIMGMNPPPPRTPPPKYMQRVPPTSRPRLPDRTPPPYRTMPPRVPTQRPKKRPATKDEISTYRPTFDLINKHIRPNFNRNQPSSQLLPPPIDKPSKIITAVEIDIPPPSVSISLDSNIVFPTPLSSGWMTSTSVDFSSKFNFAPTSIHFPKQPEASTAVKIFDTVSTKKPDYVYSYESESSIENIGSSESILPEIKANISVSKEMSTEISKEPFTENSEIQTNNIVSGNEINNQLTNKTKVNPMGNKNRTRKPFPIQSDDKKPNTSKNKHSKPQINITPTRILSRPEILYPPRVPNRKVVKPMPPKPIISVATPVLESSELSIIDDFIEPTDVLKQTDLTTILLSETPTLFENTNIPTSPLENKVNISSILPTHHAGNEIKISDDIIPTKTEFKTTVVTLTKTLSEPPQIVSSIGYFNLTHTLTVTHTKTSLISQSEGAITQTLVVTNTQTSTVVDVVTEIHTHVQPTTIVETVTKHIPIPQVQPTPIQVIKKTKVALDDISMSSEEHDNLNIKAAETIENIQKIEQDGENDSDTFFVVMNKSQNGGKSPPVSTDIETGDYDGITRNEQVNSNGVSQVLFGEILLAGTPYLETTNVGQPIGYGKECQPDCKASRNERCQRIDGMMKCVCRPGFARMFPDRPCKPTYTYSVKLALKSQGNEPLKFHESLSDNSSKQYHALAVATHEGINRMIMQSDLRDVYHGVHITGFQPVKMKTINGEKYQGVMNEFYVQLSDNAHESRLKEVIEKYLRNNNHSLGGTDVYAADELMDRLNVSDFDECLSTQFHDCSEHAQCFNLRGTYTCSCLEGYGDLSVNPLYPGRICSAEPVGCERCNYHGACYSRDDHRVLCECFQWYTGSSCQVNLKVVLISLVVLGALLTVVLAVCSVVACTRRPRPPQRSIVTCIQGMPSLHQGTTPSKQRADRRALINDRTESGDASSVQNASLPYLPSKRSSSKKGLAATMSEPPAHAPPPPPPPAVVIPRARLHTHHSESRDNLARKRSLELSNEAKLISYLESGTTTANDEMRRKHSLESSYSAQKERHAKQGALISAGFKVSTTIRPEETATDREDRDDLSSVSKTDLDGELSRLNTMRKSYSQEDMSEWTDAERRIGELTLSEARSVGGTLPASTGRAASSTRLTHQEANTMAERDLGSTFLLPHVHLYKPDLTSDVSEFDSL
ncbi:unnamed protein product [Parnassius apollo]|uniref:(apollo) hypothetical protein n=1 Tax=Parnassius apollo TaxID=110799 RepID=A0A8S3XXM6_PARAO|nr:unnamed protein product [Parnassius apollo]